MSRITSRVKISTGPKCNATCRFCYYWNNLKGENPDTITIINKLEFARSKGITEVDFSGGEPTIRADLPFLVAYAKKIGFSDICVITNGIILSDPKELNKLVEAGLTGLLFSVEGDTAELHEYIVRVPGSFKKIIKAIRNGMREGIQVRTNTTVISHNYKKLRSIVNALEDFKIDAINFIMFNSWCSAKDLAQEMFCKYSDSAPYLQKAIDEAKKSIQNITVRYIPFCFMNGYEQYVCNLLQKKIDRYEWDDAVKMDILETVPQYKFRNSKFKMWFRDVSQFTSFSNLFKLRQRDFYHNREIQRMKKDYHFSTGCSKCKYHSLCDGVSTIYSELYGTGELRPEVGKLINDHGYYYKKRKELQ